MLASANEDDFSAQTHYEYVREVSSGSPELGWDPDQQSSPTPPTTRDVYTTAGGTDADVVRAAAEAEPEEYPDRSTYPADFDAWFASSAVSEAKKAVMRRREPAAAQRVFGRALHRAAANGNVEHVRAALQRGVADVDSLSVEGDVYTPQARPPSGGKDSNQVLVIEPGCAALYLAARAGCAQVHVYKDPSRRCGFLKLSLLFILK